jgi:putative spermidine/putrescine transport system ATP-binding protein
MATLSVQSVTKTYGSTHAVDNVSLEVGDSEFVALLGPSGCGKTTLLRMVAGFVPTTQGRIAVAGRDITELPPHKRNTGMVFQSYALFPHLTVAENVAFGLKMRRVSKEETASRCLEALRLVRLEAFSGRYPRELSGGQQQRVAIARALVIRPDVFLLDEPLSNLDAKLRQSVGLEIRALQQSLGLTTLFVTHDQNEALALADRLVVMNEGRVMQSGSAAELYDRPANIFVANFLGRANLLPGRVEAPARFVSDDGLSIACETRAFAAGTRAVLCIRPENICLVNGAAEPANRFEGRVESTTYLGSTTEASVRVGPRGTTLLVHTQNRPGEGAAVPARDETCSVGWHPAHALLLPTT